jgi:hypothetical protein
MEKRSLKADLAGFAHSDVFRSEFTPWENELYQELRLAGGSTRADALMACLRRELVGELVIPAGSAVDVLAKAGAEEGDILLIVLSEAGVYAQVFDSETDPA